MVGDSNIGAIVQSLVSVKEYQGSSFGCQTASRGDPQGHYRVVEFSSGVFSAEDNRFNAYLRTRFGKEVLALYHGQTPTISLEGVPDERSGHDATRRQYVGDKMVEMSYWSNGMQGSVIPNKRGYSFTLRMEGTPAEVAALRSPVKVYLGQLQKQFGLELTNKSYVQEKQAV